MTSILNKFSGNFILFAFFLIYMGALADCIMKEQWLLFAFILSVGAFVYIEDKIHSVVAIKQADKNRELESQKLLLQIRDKELKALEINNNSHQ
jgi:hypothetical protein